MSLPVFFASAPLPARGEHTTLDGAEARHAVTVKRIAAGEHIQLIAVTETSGKDHLAGEAVAVGECDRPEPYVVVVQALPKAERSELAVDLATQAGADEIIPWQAGRCIAKWQGAKRSKGVQKWQSAAAAAAKQSRRVTVPEVREPVSTAQLAQLIDGHTAVVLHEEASQPLAQLAPELSGTVFLIVGPEGGIGDATSGSGATGVAHGFCGDGGVVRYRCSHQSLVLMFATITHTLMNSYELYEVYEFMR